MSFPFPLIRPLIFFDLETTGLDYKYDRAVEIGALKVWPDGHLETFHRRFNPGMRIPAEVTAITGLTNEEVASSPTFAESAKEIEQFFEGCDLGGYAITRFDVKMLVEEFKRAGLVFNLDGRLLIDAQSIFHQKEKRDLSAAYKFYCDRELVDAHSAKADTQATYEIFLSQLERYTDLPKNLEQLHDFCRGDKDRFVDGEGKFFWRDGEAAFNFGRYKSQTLKSVAKADPKYLEWVISPERHFSQEVVDICFRAMSGAFPQKKSVS